jgi:hypothetical protein
MPYEAAREKEVELIIGLGEAGYGLAGLMGCRNQGRRLAPKMDDRNDASRAPDS